MFLVFLAPESALVANTGLTRLAINTHFLVVNATLLLLSGWNGDKLLLDSLKAVQHLKRAIRGGSH